MKKWLAIMMLTLVASVGVTTIMPELAHASTLAGFTVTATPDFTGSGAPTDFTLTYINDFQIDITWVKGVAAGPPVGTNSTMVNTVIRVRWGEPPTDRNDGYQVYYGENSSYSDEDIDLTSLTLTPYYAAWTETVFTDNVGMTSSVWDAIGVYAEANFMSISWMFMALLLGALALTAAMFLSQKAMLGFPSAIFWALFGANAYSLSATTWDIYFTTAFAALLGMTTFSMFSAYALRTKKEEAEEGDLYFDEGGDKDVKFIDEGVSDKSKNAEGEPEPDGEKPSRRTRDIRERANRRRTRWE